MHWNGTRMQAPPESLDDAVLGGCAALGGGGQGGQVLDVGTLHRIFLYLL